MDWKKVLLIIVAIYLLIGILGVFVGEKQPLMTILTWPYEILKGYMSYGASKP